jgi:Leucine-rich repeat (LRR) protein
MCNVIKKNDLKQIHKIKIDNETTFYDDEIKNLFYKFKDLSLLEYRLYESKMEEYAYLDLSNMNLTDDLFIKIVNENEELFKTIPFLDISNNDLTTLFNIDQYPNITILSINNNKIESIECKFITELIAFDNKINVINCPDIEYIEIYNNPIDYIPFFKKLKFIKCSTKFIDEKYKIGIAEKLYNIYCIELL